MARAHVRCENEKDAGGGFAYDTPAAVAARLILVSVHNLNSCPPALMGFLFKSINVCLSFI